ncbi:MAG: DUF1573 domain-containing protein [Bacteroidetes bacterium]|nr:DUF1573 domain-containing protein [Bacteroidota bacterium]
MKSVTSIAIIFLLFPSCKQKSYSNLQFDRITVELGNVDGQIGSHFQIGLTNPNVDSSITLLGVSESCSCVTDSLKLPLIIKPKERISVSFNYRSPKSKGPFRQKIFFHSDGDSVLQKVTVAGFNI